MTSIAQRCRRRDRGDNSSYSSYDSSKHSNDDTESIHSNQSGLVSQLTDTSSIGSRGQYSSEDESELSDSDSDRLSMDDSDDSDNSNGESDIATTQSSNDMGSAAIMKAEQVFPQGSEDNGAVRSSGTLAQVSTASVTPSTGKKVENFETTNGKKLWWGDGQDESTRIQHNKHHQSPPSTLPSRKETGSTESPYNQTRGKQPGDWKSPLRNRRLDGNLQQRGGDDSGRSRPQQQPSYRSDWRKQISASSDDMAASHWTMAGINQHLLETANEEETWKKKKHDEKREAEWPTLLTDQGASPVPTHESPQTIKSSPSPMSSPTSQPTNITAPTTTNVSSTITDRTPSPRITIPEKNDNQLSPEPSKQYNNKSSTTETSTSTKSMLSPQSDISPVPGPHGHSSETISPPLKPSPIVVKVPHQQATAQTNSIIERVTETVATTNATDKSVNSNYTETPTSMSQDDETTTSPAISSKDASFKKALPATLSQSINAHITVSLPSMNMRKTRHGYLQRKNSTLGAEHALIKDDSQQIETTPSPIDPNPQIILTLQEHLDQYYGHQRHIHKKLPMDVQWWSAIESQETKESDTWNQQHREDVEKEQEQQGYYYIRPSMMPIRNPSATSENETEWMKSSSAL